MTTPAETETAGKTCAGARCTNLLRDYELRAGLELCSPCGRAMALWMRTLPRQLLILGALRERERTGFGGRGGTSTAPLPGSETVLNLLGPSAPIGAVCGIEDDQHGPLPIQETLYRCTVTVRRARDLLGPEGNSAQALAAWLEPHMAWAAQQTWGPQLHATLHAMMSTIWSITRLRPRTYAVPRPCPRCETLTLQGQDDDDKIECTVCGNLYTTAELNHNAPETLARLEREWAEQAAREAEEAEPAGQEAAVA